MPPPHAPPPPCLSWMLRSSCSLLVSPVGLENWDDAGNKRQRGPVLTIPSFLFWHARGAPLHDAVHNGGGMLFGNDGKLYVTTGDSGTKEFSQDLSTVHGSVIRLNDDGSIPSDNPFTTGNGYDAYDCRESGGRVPPEAADGAVCAEIYANGLRNPFRVAADPNVKDRTLFAISDVGARVWEELNYAGTDYAGVNYGYSTYEGPCLLASDSDCPVPDGGNFSDPFQ